MASTASTFPGKQGLEADNSTTGPNLDRLTATQLKGLLLSDNAPTKAEMTSQSIDKVELRAAIIETIREGSDEKIEKIISLTINDSWVNSNGYFTQQEINLMFKETRQTEAQELITKINNNITMGDLKSLMSKTTISRAELIEALNTEKESSKKATIKKALESLLKEQIKEYHHANIKEAAARELKEEKDKKDNKLQTNTGRASKFSFSDIASYIIPAKKDEWGKVLLLSGIGFLLVFSYSILRVPKDLLIISVGGAELIPYLKILGILPATVVSSMVWNKVKELCNSEKDANGMPTDTNNKPFYVAIAFFSIFFIGFMLLFPYLGALQGFALPFNFLPSGVNSMISFWAYSLFYVFTEMWAVITIDGLFKGLQTALFTKDRVKKLTPSFGIWSNLGLIAAGAALSGIFSVSSFTLYTQMMLIVSLFALSGLIAISLHLYGVKSSNFKFGGDTKNTSANDKNIEKDITIAATLDAAIAETSKTLANIQKTAALTLNDGWSKDTGLISTKELDTLIEEDKEIKEYTKTEKNYVKKAFNAAGGFVSKLGGIASHWDLRDLAVVILAYNICLVLFEIVWKNQVKIYTSSGTSTVSYVQFMGNFNFWTGIISITLALLGPVIDKLPPEVRSLITPLLLGALSTIFFGLVLAPTTMATICPFLFSSSVSNLYWQIALIGTIQNVIVKASKYSVFEPVNSTSWSAKPKFVKDSYQDIVNQISGKWGKGLGSLIILGLLFYGGTLTNITVYIPIVLGLVIATWCYSAYNVATTLPNSLSGDSMVTVSTTSDEFKTKMNEIRTQCKDLEAENKLEIRGNNEKNPSSNKQ